MNSKSILEPNISAQNLLVGLVFTCKKFLYFEEREYQRQKKKARDHRTACLATSWIPLVNIGTCVASAVYTGRKY